MNWRRLNLGRLFVVALGGTGASMSIERYLSMPGIWRFVVVLLYWFVSLCGLFWLHSDRVAVTQRLCANIVRHMYPQARQHAIFRITVYQWLRPRTWAFRRESIRRWLRLCVLWQGSREWQKMWTRRKLPKKGALVCIARRGYEDYSEVGYTSMYHAVYPDYAEGFAGKVLLSSEDDFVDATNQPLVRDMLKGLDGSGTGLSSASSPAVFREHLEYVKAGVGCFRDLAVADRETVAEFMVATNTTAQQLFTINDRRHCNHFLGVKVRSQQASQDPWGVVVIDAEYKGRFSAFLRADEQKIGEMKELVRVAAWLLGGSFGAFVDD